MTDAIKAMEALMTKESIERSDEIFRRESVKVRRILQKEAQAKAKRTAAHV